MKTKQIWPSISCILILLFIISTITSPVKAQTTILALTPLEYTAHQIGERFTLNLTIQNVSNLWSWKVVVKWDPAVLNISATPIEGPFLKNAGQTLFLYRNNTINGINRLGEISEMSCTLMAATSVSGSGVLATMTFEMKEETVESTINLVDTILLKFESGYPRIDHEVQNATASLITGTKLVACAGEDQTVDEDTPVTLNGSRSMPKEEILSYTWSFFCGEPKVLEGMITNFTFDVPGFYSVTLTVRNAKEEESNCTIQITVRDVTPPVAVISIQKGSDQVADVGEEILFDASQSYDPEGGTIRSYRWDWGDGTSLNTVSPTTDHSYNKADTYTVTLTVTDERGGNTGNSTATISVGSVAGSGQTRQLSLPLAVIGILAVVTALVLSGSAFWLRKTQLKKTWLSENKL